ncbi:MAG: hypothetical protein HUJ26_05700, partial [Planctomycetaceae bacterium]|nr:hypothetical protein [Planctomycetaceae bacterium]
MEQDAASSNQTTPETPSSVHRFAGLRLVSLLTLCSRVLGLVRDMLMAS